MQGTTKRCTKSSSFRARSTAFCHSQHAAVYRTKLAATEPHAPAYRPHVACERVFPLALTHARTGLGYRGYPRRVVEASIQTPLWRPAFVPLSAVAPSRDCRLASLRMQVSSWRPNVLVLSRLVAVQPLCTDELLPSSVTLRNLSISALRFSSTFSREISTPILLSDTWRSGTSPAVRTLPHRRKWD